jgi:Ca-activated chloride channel family protein
MKLCKETRLPMTKVAVAVSTALLVLSAGCSGPREPAPDATTGHVDTPPPATVAQQQEVDAVEAVEERLRNQPTREIKLSAQKQNLPEVQRLAVYDTARMSATAPICCPDDLRMLSEGLDRENYEHLAENPIRLTSEHPVSTFSIDVDTGSYSNIRRLLNAGTLPREDAVRIEELINYFDYAYPVPDSTDAPFSVSTEIAPAPWNADRLLLQIGIKGYEVPAEDRKPANLVFLVDVSGSMNSPDKLPLLKNALKMLSRQMSAQDRVSLVVYAGASGVVLEPTAGSDYAKIGRALDNLSAGGSTNGASGIRLAYDMAEQGFIDGGINRVILATDGDFNVGTVDFEALIDIVEGEREGGTSLTTLGFGTGNYNDQLMERLADAGNGNHAYIDTLNEARKVLVDQVGSTLQTIAKDVKIQVEFNPGVVAEYRLIGYENRMLRREDFNNDKIDAGEIGAGHTVTALYELSLVDSDARLVDPLRYGGAPKAKGEAGAELAYVRLRHKAPGGSGDDTGSRLIEQPVLRDDVVDIDAAGSELRFAAAVAAFGQLLKGGDYLGDYAFADVIALASAAKGADPHGYRGEFLGLARLADSLSVNNAGRPAPDQQALAQ